MGHVIGCDTETELIVPGQIPRLVVVSVAGVLTHQQQVDRVFVRELLAQSTCWANAPFDLAVLAQHVDAWDEVFDALANDRVHDVLTRQRLVDISQGVFMKIHPPKPKKGKRDKPYTLAAVAWRHGFQKDANDPWRCRYGELINTPLICWPEEAAEYARHDSIVTGEIFDAQEKAGVPGVFVDQHRQARKHFALHVVSLNGLAVDAAAVEAFAQACDVEREKFRDELRSAGILRADGTRDRAAAEQRAEETGSKYRTPKGAPSLTREACKESGDPVLEAYAEETHYGKMLDTYVTAMRSPRLHGSYIELVDTGRTAMRAPNLQNLPRAPGVRECLIADPGRCLISVDVDKAELVCLAQILLKLFGRSKLANALRDGTDPHCVVGAEIMRLPLSEFLRRYTDGNAGARAARQDAKPCNFGFPGGMGAPRFVAYCKQQGRDITLEQAMGLRRTWRQSWPDQVEYLRWIGRLAESTTKVKHFRSERLRGGLSYCDMANGFFQGLCADAMGEVLWELALAQRPGGILADSRTLVFIHDEVIVDAPLERCHEVAANTQHLVQNVFGRWTPDIPVTAGAAAMLRWSKGAERTEREGRLVPCDHEVRAA